MDEFEPPKYIQQLISAINDGAKSAQLGTLAFVAIGLFLLATSFSATDEDLLMGKSIAISQLGGVAVPVALSFGFMPAIFVAVHLYTLIRFELLAGNVRHFIGELNTRVRVEADRVRCRQLLANIEFIQALAVPGAIFVYRWTAWGIIAVFPVLVLVLVQLGSLRMQSQVVNVVHHVAIILDLLLLVGFSLLLRRPPSMARRQPPNRWGRWRRGAWRVWSVTWIVFRWTRLIVVPAAIIAADIAWFRVPEPTETTVGKNKAWWERRRLPKDTDLDKLPWQESLRLLAEISWTQPVDLWLCPDIKLGCRFLSVPGRTLVAKVWDNGAFVELRSGKELDERRKASFDKVVLQGRMLRFADLSNSLLFMADLDGAQMQGATLAGASLQGATLVRASLQGATLDNASLQGATLERTSLQGATFATASLQGATLAGASLQGVMLAGASLQGASLVRASLQGANLTGASLQGATLHGASLQGATLDTASLQGATLARASLQGATLNMALLQGASLDEASLEGATLVRASLQGASLDGASLQGASLAGASLQGASLDGASLQGARLDGASLQGASLDGAELWNVQIDESTDLSWADLRRASFAPVSKEDRETLLESLPDSVRDGVAQALTGRPDAHKLGVPRRRAGPILVSSVADRAWSALDANQRTPDPSRIVEPLAQLLADKVARDHPDATVRVASRMNQTVWDPQTNRVIDDPLSLALRTPLGCRLLAHVSSKRVTLSDDIVQRIRELTGTCPTAPASAPTGPTTQGGGPAPAPPSARPPR